MPKMIQLKFEAKYCDKNVFRQMGIGECQGFGIHLNARFKGIMNPDYDLNNSLDISGYCSVGPEVKRPLSIERPQHPTP